MVPRPSSFPQRLVRAAGALVWRPVGRAVNAPIGASLEPTDFEVLLVHRPRYRDWSWPKGKAELNEPLPQAAVREVEEETGLPVVLHSPLTVQRYRLGAGNIKEIHYWVGQELVAEQLRGPLLARSPVIPASGKEIDLTQWCKPEKAKQLLTRRGDKRLLDELVSLATAGQLTTSTVVLLRHAKAISRKSWDGTEEGRPLTRLGGMQALDLVAPLSAFGVNRLVSSPWVRTKQTIAPYSALAGIPIEDNPVLTEDEVRRDPGASRRLIEGLIMDEDASSLVCLHRPGLKPLMQSVIEKNEARQLIDNPQHGLHTAEMYVAHVAHAQGAQVVALERHSTFTKVALR